MAGDKLTEKAMGMFRIDWSPPHAQPRRLHLLAATVTAVAVSLGSDALLVYLATRLFPSTRGYSHFAFYDYATLTVVGVVTACVAWPVVTRISSVPRWLFLRLAIILTLVLWIPDVFLLVVRHEAAKAVAVLVVMHLAVAVVTYNALVHLAPVRAVTPSEEPADVGEEAGGRAGPRAVYELLAPLLGGLVAIEFVLGLAALFTVRLGRPTGLVPRHGRSLYLAHAAVGFPLALGAMALLMVVRSGSRTERLVAWLGLIGVGLAAIGGILSVSHPLRILGLVLMLIGPMTAAIGYAIPLLDRLPQPPPGSLEDFAVDPRREPLIQNGPPGDLGHGPPG